MKDGRVLLGHLAVGILEFLERIPFAIAHAVGTALLPLYVPFRFRTRAKLRRLRPRVAAFAYYRMRLRIALLSVREPDPRTQMEAIMGADRFEAALSSGRPVLLLGWHQGPVELLHRIPARHAMRPGGSKGKRSFFVMTASAFSPVLADWMARKRRAAGVAVVRPGETSALRDWARDGGVLAVMVDQVPGVPEAWLSLAGGSVKVPWPARLLSWAVARNPEILAVSTRLASGRIAFRYDRVPPEAVPETIAGLMDAALRSAPEQYNWSYGKVRVD